jgi:hypothetical protein
MIVPKIIDNAPQTHNHLSPTAASMTALPTKTAAITKHGVVIHLLSMQKIETLLNASHVSILPA